MQNDTIRLNKWIVRVVCAPGAKYNQLYGNVYINGRRAHIGDAVKIGDRVRVNVTELGTRARERILFYCL
ncbi:MAG: hypothetical protein IPP86_02495 [Bacteroidetes bacterium]|nr:hypothetical protein [Bacteroidota bacterium]